VAAHRVGPAGRVVGVDLVAVEPLGLENVTTIVGDAADADVQRRIVEAAGGPVDLLLSDLSPKLTGIRATDQAREEALVEVAIDLARRILTPGGRMVVKLFSGVEAVMTAGLRKEFAKVGTWRPPSTRKGSSEIYAIAAGKRTAATEFAPVQEEAT
jgi:23S rRNA (uridine2552-2'-O)-methyltransferase